MIWYSRWFIHPATAISTKRIGSNTCSIVVHSLSRAWGLGSELPPIQAVPVFGPYARFEVLKLARPLASSNTVASAVEPSLKVTLDEGTALPGDVAVTVAVNVTCWPNTEVGADELTCVLVAALFTT